MLQEGLANEPNLPNEASLAWPEAVRVMISTPEEMGFQTAAQLQERRLGRDEQRGQVLHHSVLRLLSSQAKQEDALTSEETPS